MSERDEGETLAGQRAEEDAYQTTKAVMEALRRGVPAEDIEAALAGVPAPKGRELIRCRSCGQAGYAGSYPFSTLGGADLCDDCV